ncbi:phospho-2-dehydro-3-deoxyheptonate aldolase [Caldisphaera lagunensis DSM 15908]|uniref:Phospho-2-dehydro-3-deoxyheptonate aldolase n=1 Tax=Caldisphaera lagunensis (strain DSM 15908 / JCM 11604 / ANMR 0165 / IC-154) TaxID=1056495 RepID=L0A7T9_CALLD|nr:phospho-2-dehydro-3-deoxyheptonate aldolase [Caldisphaera lagunensis DSM 15908]
MMSYKLVSKNYKEKTLVKVGNVIIGDKPVIIAGPCAVENREQIIKTALFVKENGAKILRGGAFKPRTSPYSFQGLGEEGLKLLREASEEAKIPFVTEVMDVNTVRLVAAYADALQVGARNMQNFPLLKELGKIDKPVFLKRGFGNTIDELLQSAEYILAGGNDQVVLVERGIRTFESSTRFTLDIAAVPVLKNLTHLPVIVDPSHAAGKRIYVPPLAKAGIAVGSDGLMIEVHPEPDKALSDGPQQLTFEMFKQLMEDLRKIAVIQ